MKFKLIFTSLIYSIIVGFIANAYCFINEFPKTIYIIIIAFFLVISSGVFFCNTADNKIRFCFNGTALLSAFYVSVIVSVIYHTVLAFKTIPNDYKTFLWSALLCFVVNFIVFWEGIICVYLSSTQLGIKLRVIGAICGFIPIVNLFVLFLIIKTTSKECVFEAKKEVINKKRKNEKICKTKYPILMVHGVFFRDTRFFNYWGRIPKELKTNGATIFYGNHASAASVADSAEELKNRIEEILKETGAEKVNIIAHSKGGLDCRYAISKLGMADKVASLTTVNTPHRGCLFADYLLNVIPSDIKNNVANTYNKTLKKFGEENADFLAAVNNLTDEFCQKLDKELATPENVYCQSIGSVMTASKNGQFPLNFSYLLAKYFDGENDGLVSEKSFKWGEKYTLLRPVGKRGISHGDVIDLNRENIDEFDVREFYVNLVNELKNKGL